MAAPTIQVLAYFGIDATTNVFILNDPVRGVLDNATYTLGGDVGIDITPYVRVGTITRGRTRALDEFSAGVATFTLGNRNRLFDPAYAAGTYFGKIKPGTHISILADGIPVFDGLIDDWNFDYPIDTDSTASFAVVDNLATLASAEFDEWTGTAGQLVGARLNAALDRGEVAFPPALRNIDTGTSTLQADVVAANTNVLNYCQLIAKCDLGQLFAAKDGTLTFYGRNRSVTVTGSPELRDDGTGIPFSAIQEDYSVDLLYNRVSVEAIGFPEQIVRDQASHDAFNKWYSLSLTGLPLETAGQALDLANYLLSLYKQPVARIASVTVYLHRLTPADQGAILNLDIGSVVRVVYTPNRVGAAIDKYCIVEGATVGLGQAGAGQTYQAVTFALSNFADGFTGHAFILDDATYGLLDGDGRLSF